MPDFYGTHAGYDAYCEARNHDHGPHSEAAVLAALLVASEWLDAKYRSAFPGLKVGQREQVREWPRTGAVDYYGYAVSSEVVPVEIEYATYEAAHREITLAGSLSVDYTPSKYKRVSVDGAVSVEYNDFDSAREAQTQYNIIDQILQPILTRSYGSNLVGGSVRG